MRWVFNCCYHEILTKELDAIMVYRAKDEIERFFITSLKLLISPLHGYMGTFPYLVPTVLVQNKK